MSSISTTAAVSTRVSARTWIGLLVVFAVIYVTPLWSPGLLDDADATHAEAAREMARTGDFVTLKVNGVRYLEKAPLPYWLVAISYRIFGENEFATRLPIALGILALALLALVWARRAYAAVAGVYAALFILTAAGVFLFTRIFIPEVLLTLFMGTTLYAWLTALDTQQPWRWYLGYATLALAVLTKGLVALVFVGTTALIYAALSGEWRRWREFRVPSGVFLFLIIAAPWHILAGLRNTGGADGHGFFWFYFVNEHFLRFLGRRFPKDYNKMPALVYWLAHLVWLFPWSLFLVATVKTLWRSLTFRPRTFTERSTLLCTIYATVILLFFSLSTNQEYYTFPAYLPLVLLVAGALASAEASGSRALLWSQAALAAIGIVIATMLLWGLWSSRQLPYLSDISAVLARRAVGGYTLSMSHFFDLTAESFAALRLPAALAAASFMLGSIVTLTLRLKHRHQWATSATAATMAVFLLAAGIAFGRFGSYLSSKSLAQEIERRLAPEDKLVIYGDQAAGSSLLFYVKRPIYLVNGATTSMHFGSTFPDAPHVFKDDTWLRDQWQSATRVYLFVPNDRRRKLESALGGLPKHIRIESGEKVVYSNQP